MGGLHQSSDSGSNLILGSQDILQFSGESSISLGSLDSLAEGSNLSFDGSLGSQNLLTLLHIGTGLCDDSHRVCENLIEAIHHLCGLSISRIERLLCLIFGLSLLGSLHQSSDSGSNLILGSQDILQFSSEASISLGSFDSLAEGSNLSFDGSLGSQNLLALLHIGTSLCDDSHRVCENLSEAIHHLCGLSISRIERLLSLIVCLSLLGGLYQSSNGSHNLLLRCYYIIIVRSQGLILIGSRDGIGQFGNHGIHAIDSLLHACAILHVGTLLADGGQGLLEGSVDVAENLLSRSQIHLIHIDEVQAV